MITTEEKKKRNFSVPYANFKEFKSISNISLRDRDITRKTLPKKEAAYDAIMQKYGIVSNPGMDIYMPGTSLCLATNMFPSGSYKSTDYIMLIRSVEDVSQNKRNIERHSFRYSPVTLSSKDITAIKELYKNDAEIIKIADIASKQPYGTKTHRFYTSLRNIALKDTVKYSDMINILNEASRKRDLEISAKVFTDGSVTVDEVNDFLSSVPYKINKFTSDSKYNTVISDKDKICLKEMCEHCRKNIIKEASPFTGLISKEIWEKEAEKEISSTESSALMKHLMRLIYTIGLNKMNWKLGVPCVYIIPKERLDQHFKGLDNTSVSHRSVMNNMVLKEVKKWIDNDKSEIVFDSTTMNIKETNKPDDFRVAVSYSPYDDKHFSVGIYEENNFKYIDAILMENNEFYTTENVFNTETGDRIQDSIINKADAEPEFSDVIPLTETIPQTEESEEAFDEMSL